MSQLEAEMVGRVDGADDFRGHSSEILLLSPKSLKGPPDSSDLIGNWGKDALIAPLFCGLERTAVC